MPTRAEPLGSHRTDDPPPPECLIPIVVGAHLRAERADRPTAHALQDALAEAIATHPAYPRPAGATPPARQPMVMTDLWYLNHDSLRAQPTICIGPPAVNALSAYLADKLPTVEHRAGAWLVQMDTELDAPIALAWGEHAETTAEAVCAFRERAMDRFLQAVRSSA